jgi:MerR family transcriptional regulator/heat shock protein HspR
MLEPLVRRASRPADAVFVISVASRLVDMHPATLRKYERVGFIEPSRSAGNVRLYSGRDIERLRQIKYLVDERGMNLAGVELALKLTEHLRRAQAQLQRDAGSSHAQEAIGGLLQRALLLLGASFPDTDGIHSDGRT